MTHVLLVDMTGEKVGKLTVIARAPNRHATAHWKCRCECGRFTVICGYALRKAQRAGKQLSCASCRVPAPRTPSAKPRRKHGRLSICELCGHMPHRVKGPEGAECARCGTVKREEQMPVPPWRSAS